MCLGADAGQRRAAEASLRPAEAAVTTPLTVE